MGKRKINPRNCAPGRNVPVFPIGVAAKLLDIHPRTLRLYEAEGLVKPAYQGSRRIYSQSDIQWITCLRSMIHEEGISIPGIKRLLKLQPCHEILDCPREVYQTCEGRVDKTVWAETNYNCNPAGCRKAASDEKCKE